MMTQVNFDSIGGGGSSVASGTFTVTSVNEVVPEIDTGLGSNLSRFVVIGVMDAHSSGTASAVVWVSSCPASYNDISAAAYGGHSNVAVGTAPLVAQSVAIMSVSNGKVNLKAGGGGSYGTSPCKGTYYWYAE